MKSYTDLEQSRKLAEIVPIESADMFYVAGKGEPVFIGNKMVAYGEDDYDCLGEPDVLCWSFAALLNVMPKEIVYKENIVFLEFHIWDTSLEYANAGGYTLCETERFDNLIDACVNMIERLHELNLL